MSADDFTIPWDRLPEGFAERVDDPPDEPAEARPAATLVLLRPSSRGPEILLLRRVRSAGFVPGAWVFPGGRVDADDAREAIVERIAGTTSERAAARLDLPPEAEPPALAYLAAAVREAFEETGILVGIDGAGGVPPTAAAEPEVEELRRLVVSDEDVFPAVLDRLGCLIDGARVEYVAHWITPVAEPRRYDTRFFAAAVPARAEASPHRAELTDARWLTPEEALRRHAEGELPMVFPTVRTIESMRSFETPGAILDHFRAREIPTVLPRLVRTPTGVGIETPDEG